MLTGADTVELKLIRDEIIQLLKLEAFELSKWASNCPELLETIIILETIVIVCRHYQR